MAFSAAVFPNTIEPNVLSRRDGKRPDGLTSYPWNHGKSLIWAVTVVGTVAVSYSEHDFGQQWCRSRPGGTRQTQSLHRFEENYIFTPLALNLLGRLAQKRKCC